MEKLTSRQACSRQQYFSTVYRGVKSLSSFSSSSMTNTGRPVDNDTCSNVAGCNEIYTCNEDTKDTFVLVFLSVRVLGDVFRRQLLPGFQMLAALADPLPTRVLGRHCCHRQLLPWGWWAGGIRQPLESASESKREREREDAGLVDTLPCPQAWYIFTNKTKNSTCSATQQHNKLLLLGRWYSSSVRGSYDRRKLLSES